MKIKLFLILLFFFVLIVVFIVGILKMVDYFDLSSDIIKFVVFVEDFVFVKFLVVDKNYFKVNMDIKDKKFV